MGNLLFSVALRFFASCCVLSPGISRNENV